MVLLRMLVLLALVACSERGARLATAGPVRATEAEARLWLTSVPGGGRVISCAQNGRCDVMLAESGDTVSLNCSIWPTRGGCLIR